MKKFKLKRRLRKALITLLVIGVFVLFAFILDKHYNNAVEDCIASGNTRVFCENTLR